MFWKWSKNIGLSLLCLVATLLIGGASYQFIGTKLDESKYPPLGQMVDVGGYKLHRNSMGSGGPTVVLESGLGCISSDWGLVQSEIAKFTTVISYDRAGMGWSEESPCPRTSQQIVEDLHTLLHNAKIPGPYILVGHSFGGPNVQLYAITYPDEVAGLVLVDSSHEEQEKRLPEGPWKNQLALMRKPNLMRFASLFGVIRFLSAFYKSQRTSIPESAKLMLDISLAMSSTTKQFHTLAKEVQSFSTSMKQLADANQTILIDKPCYVITAGLIVEELATKFELSEDFIKQLHSTWNELQNELASRFKNSKHFIAKKSDHMIPYNQPEIIIEAVHELIQELTPEPTFNFD